MTLEEAKKVAEAINRGINIEEYPFNAQEIMSSTFPEFNWQLNVDLELVALDIGDSLDE